MTAADVTGWLNRLEETHKAATAGEWSAEPNYRLEKGCRCLSCWEPIEGSWDINPIDGPDCPEHGCWHNVSLSEADAAAIVAAHNAMDALLGIVRGIVERHYPHGRNIHGDEVCAAGHSVLEPWPCPEYRAVAAALGAEVTGR